MKPNSSGRSTASKPGRYSGVREGARQVRVVVFTPLQTWNRDKKQRLWIHLHLSLGRNQTLLSLWSSVEVGITKAWYPFHSKCYPCCPSLGLDATSSSHFSSSPQPWSAQLFLSIHVLWPGAQSFWRSKRVSPTSFINRKPVWIQNTKCTETGLQHLYISVCERERFSAIRIFSLQIFLKMALQGTKC